MNHAREQYLADQVLTAPPQKLQLMLIEGAIRFVLQGRALWAQKRDQEAGEALLRGQEVLVELLSAARQSGSSLGQRAALVYLFVFQRLVAGTLERDEKLLDDALRVLEEERETWRLVCQQMGSELPSAGSRDAAVPVPAPASAIPPPNWDSRPAWTSPVETGVSFEA
jgi:flagellar protein FliS